MGQSEIDAYIADGYDPDTARRIDAMDQACLAVQEATGASPVATGRDVEDPVIFNLPSGATIEVHPPDAA